MENEATIMTCKKCGHATFMLMIMADKVRVVCSKPGCGEVPLDLTGAMEVFKRQPTRKVVAQGAPVAIVASPITA